MDEQACLRMDALVRAQALRLGAPDLGDRSVESDERTGEGVRRRLRPRERLLRRLDALERHVLLLHRGVHDQAMAKIQGMLEIGGGEAARVEVPSTAVAVLPSDTLEGTFEFDLAGLPDLTEPIRRIRTLKALIREDDNALS